MPSVLRGSVFPQSTFRRTVPTSAVPISALAIARYSWQHPGSSNARPGPKVRREQQLWLICSWSRFCGDLVHLRKLSTTRNIARRKQRTPTMTYVKIDVSRRPNSLPLGRANVESLRKTVNEVWPNFWSPNLLPPGQAEAESEEIQRLRRTTPRENTHFMSTFQMLRIDSSFSIYPRCRIV